MLVNRWMGGASFWDAVFLPCAQRETGKFCSLFSACFGGNDRAEYRNQLYHLKRTLDASPKKGLLMEGKIPAPTNNEAAPFRSSDKRLPRPLLIRTLAEKIVPSCGKVPVLLAQRAFSLVMELYAEKDAVRFLNYGVRLACWLKRYVELFFEQYRAGEHEPALVYYGPATEAEISRLGIRHTPAWTSSNFSPALLGQEPFEKHFLPHDWQTTVYEQRSPHGTLPPARRAGARQYHCL